MSRTAPPRPRTRLLPANETLPAVSTPRPAPAVSIIVLNYNGEQWLERCVASLRGQTLGRENMEIIVADNDSPDDSSAVAEELCKTGRMSHAYQLGSNFGYAEGNNRATRHAHGKYFLFLNNDSWLEPDCLEKLLVHAQAAGACVAAPLVMDYADHTLQRDANRKGFDLFGLVCGPATAPADCPAKPIFAAAGCALLVEADWFRQLGGFDSKFFMYAEEHDFCWRTWAAGGKVALVPSARAHHRSAASANPRGDERLVEIRTSDTKRFFANRNSLLVLLKNSRHLLLATAPLLISLLAVESAVVALLARRPAHFHRAFLDAVADCWRLRKHILAERRRLQKLRRHGDVWMLRFLRPGLNRWEELRRMLRFGLPRIDNK